MTIQEIKDYYEGQYAEVEIYAYGGINHRIHTDYMNSIDEDEVFAELEAEDYELMDEEDYNRTVNANCDNADFEEWYGDKDAKVLVIVLDEFWDKPWYAVLTDREDNDWGSGSYDIEEAIEMCRRSQASGNTDSYILVIDHYDNIIKEIDVPAHGTIDLY